MNQQDFRTVDLSKMRSPAAYTCRKMRSGHCWSRLYTCIPWATGGWSCTWSCTCCSKRPTLDVYMYIVGSSSVRTAFFCMYRRPGRVSGAGAVNSTSFDMSRLQVRYPMPFFLLKKRKYLNNFCLTLMSQLWQHLCMDSFVYFAMHGPHS